MWLLTKSMWLFKDVKLVMLFLWEDETWLKQFWDSLELSSDRQKNDQTDITGTFKSNHQNKVVKAGQVQKYR